MEKELKVLELFAGARCIGKKANELGMKTFSVDWTNYEGIDLQVDIEHMKKEDVPFVPDVVWASPDCATYSIAGIRAHRVNSIIPVSDYAKKCDAVNQHWINLIKEYLIINPNMVFFIENPRGMLRKMPFMQDFKRYTVWYCQYGDSKAKPTDIWTNSKTWIPREECRNYKYDQDGNIINKHCAHESSRRGIVMRSICKDKGIKYIPSGVTGQKNAHERSKIPEQLCDEILKSMLPLSEVYVYPPLTN